MPDESAGAPSLLVQNLLDALDRRDVAWCQWKSTIALDRSASGEADLDLLVARSDQPALLEVLGQLEFREASPPPEKEAAGTRSFFGFDPATQRLVHAHVHYLLMVGHDHSKGYRLPLEREFLSSVRRSRGFAIPAPELELIAFVVRMVLKHGTMDAIARGRGRLRKRDARELEWLEGRAERAALESRLADGRSGIDRETYDRARAALQPDSSQLELWRAASSLRTRLAHRSPRPPLAESAARLGRMVRYRARRARAGRAPKHVPASGGLIVAVIGADGSGKSTALQAIEDWLSPDLEVRRVHLGRPPWSRLTWLVRAGLKGRRAAVRPLTGWTRNGPGTGADPEAPPDLTVSDLARHVLTARDRRRVHADAARAAARGCIVLCDRYPLPAMARMDGPQIGRATGGATTGAAVRHAERRENLYYEPFTGPDLLFVLQVPEQVARSRKPEDDAERVTRRAREMFEIDWEGTGAVVLDATRPAAEISREMKRHIWSAL